MLSLTRIFLHNWHRFHHHIIDVKDSLYLAGHNGSGKSTVLDAIQVVIVADMVRIRFNSSAQERSQRNLDSYVRGKIGEGRYLRPSGAIGYVALEFMDTQSGNKNTIGICIEAREGRSSNRLYFVLSQALDPEIFVPEGRARSRRELKKFLRNRRWGKTFDKVGEYSTEMLEALGGLSPRFFDLFMRALTFKPIRDIRQFVEQWLLEERPLDIETLQQVVENLGILRQRAKDVEERQIMLRGIVRQQEQVHGLQELQAQHTLLAALLRVRLAQGRVSKFETQLAEEQKKIAQGSEEMSKVQAALEKAQAELLEARLELRQSDVNRREQELDEAIGRVTKELDQMRQRWHQLHRDLQQEGVMLRGLVHNHNMPIESAEREALRALAERLDALSPYEPPADLEGLADQLERTIPWLDAGKTRAQEEQFRLQQRVENLRKKGAKLEQEIAQLRSKSMPRYPNNVERLRELLVPVIGALPPLLCELLTVPEKRWQDAVEALLGQRRFNVIVPPDYFAAALEVLDEARAREKLYGVGLVDLGKVQQHARSARSGSLALKVRTEHRLALPYINTILGDTICCERAQELRRHRRAVTPDVVLYSEWTARAIPPRNYRPWMIGESGRLAQIQEREQELASIGERFAGLAPSIQKAVAQTNVLDRGRHLSNLRQRLNSDFNEQTLYQQLALYEEQMAQLDFLTTKHLEDEVARLQPIVDEIDKQRLELTRQLATWTQKALTLEHQLKEARASLDKQQQQATEIRTRYPNAQEEAEKLLAAVPSMPTLEGIEEGTKEYEEAARKAERVARRYENNASKEQRKLTEQATTYNTRYLFSSIASDPNEPRYKQELERLEATELPRFREQIEQAQRQAEEEIREHVLHKLREQILSGRQELDRLNEALTRLEFHKERYCFRYDPAEDVRDFYNLIMEAQRLGSDSLFASDFYNEHQITFDRFYELLTRTPQSEAERREQKRLADYRGYLTYDIEVTHADGRTSRLSRIMGQTSGGETQTPFYLTIAASFVQLYNLNQHTRRPTIRLIAFDETFSKMDQDRIGSTLDLFQKFQLQIITATPLERCEYLVPKICTNLVLTGIGDRVLIEPYRNYKAQLERSYGTEEVLEEVAGANGDEQ